MALTRPKIDQINTSIMEINDSLIMINANHTGANTNDLGIIMERGTSGDNVGIIWDRSASRFVLAETTADGDSTGDITFSAVADLEVDNLEASLVDITGDIIRVQTSKTPASASDTGTTGDICWDSTYVYVCIATNQWKRALISTW